jgi:hypothetical protein
MRHRYLKFLHSDICFISIPLSCSLSLSLSRIPVSFPPSPDDGWKISQPGMNDRNVEILNLLFHCCDQQDDAKTLYILPFGFFAKLFLPKIQHILLDKRIFMHFCRMSKQHFCQQTFEREMALIVK